MAQQQVKRHPIMWSTIGHTWVVMHVFFIEKRFYLEWEIIIEAGK
jgi:hypothetical protein